MGALAQASGRHRRGPDGAYRQRGRQGDRRQAPARTPLPADGLGLGGTRDDGRNRSPGRAGDAARPAPVHRPGDARTIRLRNSEPHRHPLRRRPHRRRGTVDRDRRPADQARDRGASHLRPSPPAPLARRLAEPGAGGHPGHSRRPGTAHGDPEHGHRPQGPRLGPSHARGPDQPDPDRTEARSRRADRRPLPRHPGAQVPHHPAAQSAREDHPGEQKRPQGARGRHREHVREPHPRGP